MRLFSPKEKEEFKAKERKERVEELEMLDKQIIEKKQILADLEYKINSEQYGKNSS
jgi:hypothetical protein